MPRGGSYEPLEIKPSMALVAVRARLAVALLSAFVAAACVMMVMLGPQTQFGSAALASFGFTSLALAVASLLGARREESVHRLASDMDDVPLLAEEGADGSV